MKILKLIRDRLIAIGNFWLWFFGINQPKEEHLPTVLEMRKEIIDLQGQVRALKRVNEALICDRFGTYEADDLDINTLQLQYGSFFINAAFDRHFMPDELMFFKRTFMQAIACAYQLGLKKDDRATKSTS